MPAPILLDLSHTSHTRARTGIQRVTRSLHTALGTRAVAVTHDPYLRAWRTLQAWELGNLTTAGGAGRRGAQWPARTKLRGRWQQWLGRHAIPLPANSGLLVPEVFSPVTARALPQAFSAARGPRVAVFHDALAVKLPELTPAGTVARFPAYLVELLAFDGIAAVSEDSRSALVDYWRWLGVSRPPPVRAIPLGVDVSAREPSRAAPDAVGPITVLCVGSLEGRKNHVALLDGCEQLWQRGETFSLRLIGIAHPQTGAAALDRVRALQAAGRPLHYEGPARDAEVEAAYAACTFTVYPSIAEGFGLPIIESLAHGKPCICSAGGAIGESARGGGCVMLDRVDAAALATAIAGLLAAPLTIAALADQARSRRFRTWAAYADDMAAWIQELRPAGGSH